MARLQGHPFDILASRLVAIIQRRRRSTLREELPGAGGHAVLAGHGSDWFGMLVIMRPVIVLHQSRIAMVEIDDPVGDQVLFVVKMDLLGWNS